jgi:prepilin-type N-terminal cleavage/methylation domain-containing protein
MENRKHKCGVTLIEMLIVLAIIALLATMVIGIASQIDNKSKENLTKNTIEILTAALEQFREYGYRYRHSDYSGFEFPLDCNGFSVGQLQTTLKDALGAASVLITGGTHEPDFSGSEVLYLLLSRIPDCRETLEKIDSSLITDKDSLGNQMKVAIDGQEFPLLRVVDPWLERGKTAKTGKSLRYDYYDEKIIPPDPRQKRTFPVITSAGPDGIFNTNDDISSK